MVSLRDGRKLIGVLRSWDQFGTMSLPFWFFMSLHRPRAANLVLQSTIERFFVPPTSPAEPGLYADEPHGIFLVRGENVLLLGEIDLDKDDEPPPGYELADLKYVKKLDKERLSNVARKDKTRLKKLAELGFEGENSGEMLL